ncbi:MAG TPA: DUF4230 domain-containing protein [Candidatus Uhrbacteria bacterium]|nr:DUF4230 domain-containing protein [Candidatus Uhrbacteria bacterium]
MKQYFLLVVIFLSLVIGLLVGYLIFKPQSDQIAINSLVIYSKLQNQGFLITQDYVLEQKLTIDNTTGQWWKDIFWGQQIETSAVIKISLGVDLHKLESQDVQINNKKITLNLPAIEIKSMELVSDINLQNSQGVLKRLLDNDDGYNKALAQLKDTARQAALEQAIITRTQAATVKEITKLVNLIAEDKDMVVKFKE